MKGKHYIVQIVGFEGEDAILTVEHNGFDEETDEFDEVQSEDGHMYAIVQVDKDGASIVDNGYRTIKEAKAAWPEAIEPSPEHLVHEGRAFAQEAQR